MATAIRAHGSHSKVKNSNRNVRRRLQSMNSSTQVMSRPTWRRAEPRYHQWKRAFWVNAGKLGAASIAPQFIDSLKLPKSNRHFVWLFGEHRELNEPGRRPPARSSTAGRGRGVCQPIVFIDIYSFILVGCQWGSCWVSEGWKAKVKLKNHYESTQQQQNHNQKHKRQ